MKGFNEENIPKRGKNKWVQLPSFIRKGDLRVLLELGEQGLSYERYTHSHSICLYQKCETRNPTQQDHSKAEKPQLMPTIKETLIFQVDFAVWRFLLCSDSLWHTIYAIIKASR